MANPIEEPLKLDVFKEILLDTPGCSAYALLDGARIPDLLPNLDKFKIKSACLYRGYLTPKLEAAAPYLVSIPGRKGFLEWYLEHYWGKSGGIFLLAPNELDLKVLRRHFRKFLKVRTPPPENKIVYFRFYDPRVMRNFLPACNPAELKQLMEGLRCFLYEAEDSAGFFVHDGEQARLKAL